VAKEPGGGGFGKQKIGLGRISQVFGNVCVLTDRDDLSGSMEAALQFCADDAISF
jgi:hypothetical protein